MTATRRSFLLHSAAATSTLLLPGCGTGPQPKRRPPRDPAAKLRLMVIGVGGRGHDNLQGVAGEDVAVLCDVDQGQLAAAAAKFPVARAVRDFRAVLQDDAAVANLDGVVISTPDHTHYPAAMLALQQGLDVYCEKPLTHTVAQARRLMQTAEQNGCVTQLGTQIHANANYRRVVEAIQAGAVGPVRTVHVFVNGTNWSAKGLPQEQPVPAALDYDLWLGPVASRPYAAGYHPAGWRRWWAFGGGTTADMGCHFVDLAFWALGLDAPVALRADGPEPEDFGAPAGMRCWYRFPARGARGEVALHWYCGNDRPVDVLLPLGLERWQNGVLFVGDDGHLISNYDKFELGPAPRAAEFVHPAPSLPPSPGHHAEWLQCCRTRARPSCHFGYGGPLTETVLLANVAYRAARGKELTWDAAALRIGGSAEAAALLDIAPRDGWNFG